MVSIYVAKVHFAFTVTIVAVGRYRSWGRRLAEQEGRLMYACDVAAAKDARMASMSNLQDDHCKRLKNFSEKYWLPMTVYKLTSDYDPFSYSTEKQ